MDIKYPNVTVQLTGEDGNSFMIVGRIRQALKRAGVQQVEIDAFSQEAMSGDRDHLLQTCMKTVNVT
jgi:hypothetical protein